MNPSCSYNEDGSLKSISGGHRPKEYLARGLLDFGDDIFVGQDNKVIGALVGNTVAKTMQSGITNDSIINNVRTGQTLAKNPENKNDKLSRATDGSYFCTLTKRANSLSQGSQFPVLVVDGSKKDKKGNLYVGKFGKLNSLDSSSSSAVSSPTHEKLIYVSPTHFTSMMRSGKQWASDNPDVTVVNITEPLQAYCSKNLEALGMHKFPGQVFGVQDFRNADNNGANAHNNNSNAR